MFAPNTTAKLYKMTGYDDYAKPQYAKASVVPCSLITYDVSLKRGSVRTDMSGSGGRSEELKGVARFLFPRFSDIAIGDVITKDGKWLEVIEVNPRRSVLGEIDHVQVDFRKVNEINAS